MTPPPDRLYRYVDVAYASMSDEYGESRGSGHLEVELKWYDVVRRTPKGAWIADCSPYGSLGSIDGHLRFVLLTARKRFACPTKEEALESFIARKTRQASIYAARLDRARRAIVIARMKTTQLVGEQHAA
jgi:hypothetical protein